MSWVVINFKKNEFEIFKKKLKKKLNIKVNGFKLEDYISNFSDKIYGIHLKKRNFLFNKSLPIKTIFKEVKTIVDYLNKFKNIKDICIQNFRSDKNYIKDTQKALRILKKLIFNVKYKTVTDI
jgi:hypothetical protein